MMGKLFGETLDYLLISKPEGWLSGRKRIPAKDVCSYATWVRIPFLPFLNVTKHNIEKLEKKQKFFQL